MDRRKFLRLGVGIGVGAGITLAAPAVVGQITPPPIPPYPDQCRAVCFRDPDWWRWNMNKIPYGLVIIPFFNNNQLASTVNRNAIEVALGRSSLFLSPQRQLIRRFVAAQLSLLRARGQVPEDPFLATPLSCYGFTATLSLSNNATISGTTTLRALLDLAGWAATTTPANDTDCLTLVDVLAFLERTCAPFA